MSEYLSGDLNYNPNPIKEVFDRIDNGLFTAICDTKCMIDNLESVEGREQEIKSRLVLIKLIEEMRVFSKMCESYLLEALDIEVIKELAEHEKITTMVGCIENYGTLGQYFSWFDHMKTYYTQKDRDECLNNLKKKALKIVEVKTQ